LSPNCRRQKERLAKNFGLQKKISSRSFLSPGRFVEKKGEKGFNNSRVFGLNKKKFQFELVCNDFENLPKIDSRVFKHDQKI
jgi:hypothetical protein